MCGIAGVVNFKESVDVNHLHQMMNIIKHRGPDDEGFYVDNNISIGHVRLSIIDLSKRGHQPMFSNDNRYVISFNGEIYNYIELKEELSSEYKFVTSTDTEVILASYIKWGKNCLNKFNGDWSFVIYDTKTKEIFGARDRYGIKPFYYYKDEFKMIFSSEIKAIIPMIDKKTPNEKLIFEYLLYNRTDQSQETFFKDIFKLKHGHYFTLNGDEIKFYNWYNLKEKIKENKKTTNKEYRSLLNNSVKIRLRSDVPLGISLSGGIDSSALTSLVFHDFNRSKLQTFSATYEKGTWADESEFVDCYKNLIKNMHYITPDADSFYKDFEKFIYTQGEPVASIGPYAQFKVMELASNKVKVTLDGQGADELLAGYHYFFGSYFKELLYNFKFLTLFSEVFCYLSKHRSLDAIKFMLFYIMPKNLKTLSAGKISPYIKKDFIKKWKDVSTIEMDLYSPKSLNDSLIDHFEYKLEHLLKWDDLNSMNFSIESRVPFMDHNLVEATLALAPNYKITNATTKYILRESIKDILPEKIYNRIDKKGFSTPSDEWFKSDKFKKYINNLLNSNSFKKRGFFNVDQCKSMYANHVKGQTNATKDIWKWINLELWFRKYID